jgi:hypothetical protein
MHTAPIGIDIDPEQYSLIDLMNMPVGDKVHNAESYAALAGALYMAEHMWVDNIVYAPGEPKLLGLGALQHVNQRPSANQLGPHAFQ